MLQHQIGIGDLDLLVLCQNRTRFPWPRDMVLCAFSSVALSNPCCLDFGCLGKQLLSGKAAVKSEDCMTVNIFRQKRVAGGKKMPVAAYIHGGAFNRGSCKF